METNLKIVKFGKDLSAVAKRYDLIGRALNEEQVQRLCTYLGRELKIPAVPYSCEGECTSIITEVHYHIPARSFDVDNWAIKIEPSDKVFKISLANFHERQLVADLYKRSLLIQVSEKTTMWTLDSPRIFYEKAPFIKADFVNKLKHISDIEAYRRFEVSEDFLENEGLAFSVNVSTAFFTSLSVDDYFTMNYVGRFKKLAGRQSEQKGTLMYDSPKGRMKCYFEQYCSDMTLATTRELVMNNKRYANLYAYYQTKYPEYAVKPTDKVALVSFPGFDKPVPVVANKLFLRVMNDMLEHEMSQKDKIDPQARTYLINKFWTALGRNPFGKHLVEIGNQFYQPNPDNSGYLKLPPLLFGQNAKLNAPVSMNAIDYKKNFNSRKTFLEKFGCYFAPTTMEREIHFIYPGNTNEKLTELFANQVCEKIKSLTGITVQPIIDTYVNCEDMTTDLMLNQETGLAVFIFDDMDAATYFNIRHDLKGWKLKRVTSYEINRTYKGYKDFKDGGNNKGERNWNSFVELNVLDILQQLGCLPYMVEPKLNYDMQLIIDVSDKSSHIALSLFMFKDGMKIPISDALIKPKTEKTETINKIILEKYLKELFINNKDLIRKQQMKSLLVLRDGKDCGEEYAAIQTAIQFLVDKQVLCSDFKFDFVEYHKSSLKGIRIWNRNGTFVTNALEGSYLLLDKTTAILATTGEGTLNQGTAMPVLIKTKYSNCDLLPILSDIFVSSQLNFSSPRVAQRLTFSAKRADEQLKDRMAQEIFRIN